MLTKKQIETFRKKLLKEKHEITERLKSNDQFGMVDGAIHEARTELSSYDNHPADEGTELFERSKDFALNELEENRVKNIDKALEAIDKGTYGLCEHCGKSISIERLDALPETTYCKEHSPEQQISRDRPVEEEVLSPPYERFVYDDEEGENTSFDAEDAWQEVGSFGSSDSPQDFFDPSGDYNDATMEHDEKVGYVEDYENFIGTDIYGKNITIYPNRQHEKYEEALDEAGYMTTFGDLHPFELDPYVDND
ncbi:TraR/DksA C4-type zinc finger protein [Bacillus kwashiorkori]|uniref:TraR/DksA C4-type zinc finger protein n=1 Tax=Bacillus kwashiorkori TaxID=1522318 RepID=UPI000781C418|nr:TraR/DksA C4-type zinc finger protein [Bacillus kwashiorkori]